MIISSIVNQNFSRSPGYYDECAVTQQEVAERLGKIIFEKLEKEKVSKVLEIGCGTGFLSEIIVSEIPDSSFLLTDISEPMLDYCRDKFEQKGPLLNIHFKVNDITQEIPDKHFDLICSSLSFQWIENIKEILTSLHSHISDEGFLVFTTLLDGTFANIAEIFDKHDVHFPIPELQSIESLRESADSFSSVEIIEGTYIEKYNSIKEFLDHIHKVGAGNATGSRTPLSKLREIIKEEKKNGEIIAEYKVAFVVAKKL